MPVLYFVRHGETDWNREGRLQGQTDIPLNERGRGQARAVSGHFRQSSVIGLSSGQLADMPLHASPMARAHETMQLMLGELGMAGAPVTYDDRLKEIRFGDWEGKTWPELRAIDPHAVMARERDRWGHVPPGGESYEMVAKRVNGWIETLTSDSIVVAHGGIARVILVLLAKRSRKQALGADIWQGKVLRVEPKRARWVPGPGHH